MRVSPSLHVGLDPVNVSREREMRGFVPPSAPALAASVLALSLVLSSAFSPARANDGDFFQNILGAVGLVDPQKPNIQYRERSPLVVPPGAAASTLPVPKESAANTNPNWPKDPDVARAKQAKAEDKSPILREDPGRPLLPSQLSNGRAKVSNSSAVTEPVGAGKSGRDELMPSELGFRSWAGVFDPSKDKPLTFNGEPTRDSLTEPPPGYQTPAPNAPYGVVEKKKEDFKFPSFFDLQNTNTRN